jgi:hypothetical protein
MTRKRFTTNLRLWFWISLVLFVICWLLPIGYFDGWHFPMGIYVISLFSDFDHFGEYFGPIAICSLIFVGVAVAIGWVIQCIVVMIREAKRRPHDAA